MNLRGIILGVILLIGASLVLLSQKGKGPEQRQAIVGIESPEFTLARKDGTEIKLSQFIGKTVFLHFWASWCKECRDEMAAINALFNRKKSDPNFTFLSVIYRESVAKTEAYLKNNNFDIPLYLDLDEKTANKYGVTGVPETFLVSPDGILKKRIIGPINWEEIRD